MTPSIGRIVHYTSYGTPGGEYPSTCRAAVVTAVSDPGGSVHLFVMSPEGVFLNKDVPYNEVEHKGGTWHWPERVE